MITIDARDRGEWRNYGLQDAAYEWAREILKAKDAFLGDYYDAVDWTDGMPYNCGMEVIHTEDIDSKKNAVCAVLACAKTSGAYILASFNNKQERQLAYFKDMGFVQCCPWKLSKNSGNEVSLWYFAIPDDWKETEEASYWEDDDE